MRDPEEKNKEYEPDYFLGEDDDPGFDEEFLQDNWDEIVEDFPFVKTIYRED